MRFQDLESFQAVCDQLSVSDFETMRCAWDPDLGQAKIEIQTSRPVEQEKKGWFSGGSDTWCDCVLVLEQVTALSLRQVTDGLSPESLMSVSSESEGFLIQLQSAQGLRAQIHVGQLVGQLLDQE